MTTLARQVRAAILQIQPYVAGLSDDTVRQQFGGQAVVKLNSNENAVGPSRLAIEAILSELEQIHHYPDPSSDLLRQAIAEFHGVQRDQVLVGNGSDEVIRLISETFLSEGDEVLVPAPTFSQYQAGAFLMGATVRRIPLSQDFQYDVDAFLSAVTNRTKLLYLCSPNNPTGTVVSQHALSRLLAQLPSHVFVVLDFAYNDYARDETRAVLTPQLVEGGRVIALQTFSKLYGLAGLRVGYAVASAAIWDYVHRIREPFNVNRLAQRAAAAALMDDQHRTLSRLLCERGMDMYGRLADVGYVVIPSQANFVSVRTGDGERTYQQLLQEGILVRKGFAGMEEYVRITMGLEEENEQCILALLRLSTVSS